MPEMLRWGACFALALCFHAVVVAALLEHWTENSDLVANAPVITIDLAPLAVAPDTKPSELPPGPQQAEAEPEPEPDPVKPVEKLELPPEPNAEPLLAVTPPPKPQEPKEEKPKQQHASLPSAPSTAETKAERAAAPAPPRVRPWSPRCSARWGGSRAAAWVSLLSVLAVSAAVSPRGAAQRSAPAEVRASRRALPGRAQARVLLRPAAVQAAVRLVWCRARLLGELDRW